jgi:hypothetical protein
VNVAIGLGGVAGGSVIVDQALGGTQKQHCGGDLEGAT